MTPDGFKQWRKLLGLSQKEAAEALGLKRRVVQYYEKGERDGETVQIPKAVRLACWALSQGTTEYQGPTPEIMDGGHLPKKEKKALKVVKERVKGAAKDAKDAPKAERRAKPSTPDLGGDADEDEDGDDPAASETLQAMAADRDGDSAPPLAASAPDR